MSLPPVIVLGDYLGALGAIQSLGARGVPCWVGAPVKHIAGRSRYARFCPLPRPSDGLDLVLDGLRVLRREIGAERPAIIAADEPYAAAVAELADALEPDFAVCRGPASTVALLRDKGKLASWAGRRGILCPATWAASHEFEPSSYPIVVKPADKFDFWQRAGGSPGIGAGARGCEFRLIESPGQWQAFRLRFKDELEKFIVQEFVPGDSSDVYSVGIYADRHAQVLGTLVFRKIRGYPAQYGETKAGQNDRVPPELLRSIHNLVRDLSFHGIAEFEFRRSAESGEYYLLDVNPRCWTWIAISVASVANIPWIAYQDLCGISQVPVMETRPPGTIKYVFLTSDLLSVLVRYRKDHPEWCLSLADWRRSLRAERLVIAEANQQDWPAAVQFGRRLVGNAWRRARHGTPTRQPTEPGP